MSIGNKSFGFGSNGSREGSSTAAPPTSNARLTEAGDRRITEAGDARVTE